MAFDWQRPHLRRPRLVKDPWRSQHWEADRSLRTLDPVDQEAEVVPSDAARWEEEMGGFVLVAASFGWLDAVVQAVVAAVLACAHRATFAIVACAAGVASDWAVLDTFDPAPSVGTAASGVGALEQQMDRTEEVHLVADWMVAQLPDGLERIVDCCPW